MSWEKYEWDKNENEGKLTYYYCNINRSDLPVRDVCVRHKNEPHYEGDLNGFGTYNECTHCNPGHINSMIEKEKANILFFVTCYTGKLEQYRSKNRRYFVTGYYKVDETRKIKYEDHKTRKIKVRQAIKCYSPKFVAIEDAFEINEAKLRKWGHHRKSKEIFGDQLKFYLERGQTRELLEFFRDKKNVLDEYITETRRLESECQQTTKRNTKARKCCLD